MTFGSDRAKPHMLRSNIIEVSYSIINAFALDQRAADMKHIAIILIGRCRFPSIIPEASDAYWVPIIPTDLA